MTDLRHDADGFLTGDILENLGKIESGIAKMSDDIAAIRAILANGNNSPPRVDDAPPPTPANAENGNSDNGTPPPSPSPPPPSHNPPEREARPTATPRQRNSQGRFSSGDNEGASASSAATATPNARNNSGIDLGESISKLAGAIDENQQIDPAIQAMSEVMTPLSRGFGMLFGGESDKNNNRWYKRIWRQMLRQERRDAASDSITHRRLRGIEERPNEGGGMGWLAILIPLLLGIAKGILVLPLALLGGLGGLLAKLLPAAIRARLPSLGGRGRNGRDPPPIDPPDADRRGRRGRRGRDRNPPPAGDDGANPPNPPPNPPNGDNGRRRGGRMRGMRGLGWLAAGAALFGAATVEADDSLTREEKNQEHGASAGAVVNGVGGAMAGAAIGTMIFPGVGTVIGGLIGGYAADYFTGDAAADLGARFATWVSTTPLSAMPGQIVDKFGEWTQELKDSDVGQWFKDNISPWVQSLVDSDIGKFVKDKWESLTGDIKSTWDSFSKTLADTWNGLKEGAKNKLNEANEWIKKKTGVDVGATATAAYEATKTAATNAYDATKEAATSAYEYTKDAASEAVTGRKSSVNERWNGGARDDIVAAAKATGMDAGVLANIANYESMGFKHDARPISKSKPHLNTERQFDGTMAMSTAYGYGQFTDGTWMDTLNKHGSKHGVAGAGSLTKDQANAFRKDRKLQAIMLAEFSKDNIATAKKYGGTDDLANAYALHNLGGGDGGGGAKFLKAMAANPNAKVSSVLSGTVIERNTGLYGKSGDKTLAEAYKGMSAYMHEGDSYAQEAHNLQNGITAPTMGGMLSMGAGIFNAGKAASEKFTEWKDDNKPIPEHVKQMRIKDTQGNTKTVGEMGITTYGELKSKGGQAFEGGVNDPTATYATSLIQQGMGTNFGRVTAQNDAYHQKNSPKSGHTKGNKTDYTVQGMNGSQAEAKTHEIMAKWGLQKDVDFKLLNEYDNPSAKATGGHMDFQLNPEGQAKIAKIMALEQLSGGMKKPDAATSGATGAASANYYEYGYDYKPQSPAIAKAANIPAAPVITTPPKAPDAPAEFSPISSGRPANQSPVNVTLPEFMVGQDVRDRRIAHIATGGVSG